MPNDLDPRWYPVFDAAGLTRRSFRAVSDESGVSTSAVSGLRWAHNVAELADELWVDEPTVLCRLDSLDPVEVAELHAALGDDWRVA